MIWNGIHSKNVTLFHPIFKHKGFGVNDFRNHIIPWKINQNIKFKDSWLEVVLTLLKNTMTRLTCRDSDEIIELMDIKNDIKYVEFYMILRTAFESHLTTI